MSRKVLQENHLVGQESCTGKSVGCTVKWARIFYRKVSDLYRKLGRKVSQESLWVVQESGKEVLT